MRVRVLLLALILVVLPEVALAQIPDLNSLLPPGNGSTSGRIIQLMALITVLSLAPSILVMVTSFTRIVIVLSFLRNAMGLQRTHGTERPGTDTYSCAKIHDRLRVGSNAIRGRAAIRQRPQFALDALFTRKSFDAEIPREHALHIAIENRMTLVARQREDCTGR